MTVENFTPQQVETYLKAQVDASLIASDMFEADFKFVSVNRDAGPGTSITLGFQRLEHEYFSLLRQISMKEPALEGQSQIIGKNYHIYNIEVLLSDEVVEYISDIETEGNEQAGSIDPVNV